MMSYEKIKICHFEASLGLGSGEYFVDLANAQAEKEEYFSEIIIVSPYNAKYLKRISSKVRHISFFSKGSRNNPFLLWELYTIFKDEMPDIVHTHFNKATKIYSRFNKFLKSNWVATKHNPRPTTAYKRAPHVIAVSKEVSNSLENKNITIIYNGIRIEKLPSSIPVKSPQIIKILAVGRLEKIKGFDRLIKALSKINNQLKWTLSIAGEGSERNTLWKLSKACGCQDKVMLLGHRRDVPSLMHEHDLVVISSLSEGFSLVILEAILFAPLLASTPVGIATEVLPDSLILPHHDFSLNLEEIIQNYTTMCDQLKLNRKAIIDRFSMRNAVDKHIHLYKSMIRSTDLVMK